MRRIHLGLSLFIGVACSLSGVRGAPVQEDRTLSPSTAAGERWDAAGDLPLLEPGVDFHVVDPRLEDFLRILLRENPDILAARNDWKAARQRPAQVRSLPDPQFGIRYFVEEIETRVGPQEAVFELSQDVPWLSKLSTNGRRAERLAASSRQDVRRTERDRVRDFKRVYYDLVYVVEALQVNREEQELLGRFEQIALTRYATGEGIQQNVIKVQTEITRLMDQETFLLERRGILLRRLAQLLGRPGEGSEFLGGIIVDLPDPALDFDRRGLERAALESRPEILALRERIAADDFLVTRRRLEWRPDFRFGVAYTDVGNREDPAGILTPPPDNGENALAFLAGIRIPLYKGRISSGVREALEIREGTTRRLESEGDRAQYEVQEGVLRLDSLLDRTGLYRDTLIPQAEESLASSEAAYQTNQLDFLDLLDAERVWFQVRLAYRRLLSDVWITLADLERAIGRKFPTAIAAGAVE